VSKYRRLCKIALPLVLIWLIPEIYLYPMFLLYIKPTGEEKINEILSQVNRTNDTFEKLKMIVEWEVKDFTNAYNRRPDFFLDPFYRYPVYFDNGVKVRVLAPVIPELSNNPYWTAFFKVGACGELASLFNEVANRAGIKTRIVGTKGEDHSWVEVKINGEWIHADPTLYFLSYRYHLNIKWINNPRFYDLIWFNISKVFVKGSREDVTRRYTDTGTVIVHLTKPADRIVVKIIKNGKEREVTTIDVNSSVINIELGGKTYNITAEKDLIPNFIVLKETKRVLVIEGSTTKIDLSTQCPEFKPLFYVLVTVIVVFIFIWKYRGKWHEIRFLN